MMADAAGGLDEAAQPHTLPNERFEPGRVVNEMARGGIQE